MALPRIVSFSDASNVSQVTYDYSYGTIFSQNASYYDIWRDFSAWSPKVHNTNLVYLTVFLWVTLWVVILVYLKKLFLGILLPGLEMVVLGGVEFSFEMIGSLYLRHCSRQTSEIYIYIYIISPFSVAEVCMIILFVLGIPVYSRCSAIMPSVVPGGQWWPLSCLWLDLHYWIWTRKF